MKKFLVVFLAIMLMVGILALNGCGKKEKEMVDKKLISETVTHIKAYELDDAIDNLESMNENTLDEGKEKLIKAIAKELKEYLKTKQWMLTEYVLVRETEIEDLKKYKEMLEIIPLDDISTNTLKFVNQALELEELVQYNDYHRLIKMNSAEKMAEYAELGSRYNGISYTLAVEYYRKVITEIEHVLTFCEGKETKGMKETYEYYSAIKRRYENLIAGYSATQAEIDELSRLDGEFDKVSEEFKTALGKLSDIESKFPKKIY